MKEKELSFSTNNAYKVAIVCLIIFSIIGIIDVLKQGLPVIVVYCIFSILVINLIYILHRLDRYVREAFSIPLVLFINHTCLSFLTGIFWDYFPICIGISCLGALFFSSRELLKYIVVSNLIIIMIFFWGFPFSIYNTNIVVAINPEELHINWFVSLLGSLLLFFVTIFALPDHFFAALMVTPDLCAIKGPAAAEDFAGKRAVAAGELFSQLGAAGNFALHQIEGVLLDDGGMAVGDIILRHFAFVFLYGFAQKIYGEGLLKQGIAGVFFVLQDAFDRRNRPDVLPAWTFYALIHKGFYDEPVGQALQEQGVNPADNPRLLFNDFREAVLAFFVAQKALVGHADIAVREAFAVAPGHVLADVFALFLCHAGQDGYDEFAVAVHGVEVFGFEENIHALGLQLVDGVEGIDRVAGKTAD